MTARIETINNHWLRALRWITALVLVFPLLAWYQHTGNPLQYLQPSSPPGQWAYVLSKLLGLYAMLVMVIQIVAGLLLRKGHQSIHRYIGCLVLTLMLLHGGLFVLAVSLRSGHMAWHLLAPTFSKGYYNGALALGVLALWGTFVLLYAGIRLAKGYVSWKRAHWLSLPIFVAAFSHGWMIGTESQSDLYQIFYVVLALMVLMAVCVRGSPGVIAAINHSAYRQPNL